jgi:hypothetical protein
MIARREWLGLTVSAGAALTLRPALLAGVVPSRPSLLTRGIPSSGEQVPLIGLGSSATVAQVARGIARDLGITNRIAVPARPWEC